MKAENENPNYLRLEYLFPNKQLLVYTRPAKVPFMIIKNIPFSSYTELNAMISDDNIVGAKRELLKLLKTSKEKNNKENGNSK